MEMQKEQVGDAHVVTVVGRLDGIYSSAFANQVGELITGKNPKILIDFSRHRLRQQRRVAGAPAAREDSQGIRQRLRAVRPQCAGA